MPIYEYVCEDCNEKYDKFVRSSTAKIELECPQCGSEKGSRAFSAFSSRGAGSSSFGSSVPSAPAACGPVG